MMQIDPYANINPVSSNNTTIPGTSSLYLNGGTTSKVSLTKSFDVLPGDTVSITANARFTDPGSMNSGIADITAALLSAFNLSAPAPSETGTPSSALNYWGGLASGGYGSRNTAGPKAFVNIIIFDKDYNFLDVSYSQVTASGTPAAISAAYTIKEPGYAYIYVSNEHPTAIDVYFDDVTVKYAPSNIVQYNEYYPFGLQTTASWTRESNKNNFLYNAGNELNQNSGWYEMFFRDYDPALGRMLQVDPYATAYASHTPYNYAVNNPVYFNDPNGAQSQAPPGVSQMGYNRMNRISGMSQAGNYYEGWDMDFSFFRSTGGYDVVASISLEGYSITGQGAISALISGVGRGYSLSDIVVNGRVWCHYCGNEVSRDVGTGLITYEGEWLNSTLLNAKQDSWWFEDKQGKFLFDHWVGGSGKTFRFINGEWGEYMKNNHSLFSKIMKYLRADSESRTTSGKIHTRLSMVLKDNDYTTGYGLLHGSEATVGGFEVWGDVTVDSKLVTYNLLFTWHDIIDPNPDQDIRDGIYAPIIRLFKEAKNYQIHISWSDVYEFPK